MLEMLGVADVGSGPQAHGIPLSKVIAEIVLQNADGGTPRIQMERKRRG